MKFIFLNSKTNESLTMPVTPAEWSLEEGRAVESLDMAQTGQVNLPSLSSLFNEQLTFLLPSSVRNYTDESYSGDPYAIVAMLVRWSKDGSPLRLIITDTTVNTLVLFAPIRYSERDGTGDVYVTLTMRQYRELIAETTEKAETGNTGRSQPETAASAETTYTVVKGNTLWGICRKFYGDGQLAWKLAAFNGIKNANLIYPGQLLRIPAKSNL